jgi:hypothetical protein
MARHQNTVAKRLREMAKKRKAEEKRIQRNEKKQRAEAPARASSDDAPMNETTSNTST